MQLFENQQAERAAIATILQTPALIHELDNKISAAAFHNPANRALVQLAIDLNAAGFDIRDRELMRNKVVLVPVVGIEAHQMQDYVTALLSAEIEPANFNNYVRELQEAHLKESLHKILIDATAQVMAHSPGQVIGDLQTQLYDLDHDKNNNEEPVDIGKTIRTTIMDLINQPLVGIPSGIDILDDITMGWLPRKLYMVGARPGRGKSAIGLQWASHAAFFAKDHRVPVLYMDTEIDDREFKIRLTGHLAGVDTKIIQQGIWGRDPRQEENVKRALQFVEQTGGIYHKELPGYSVSSVVNTIRKYVYNFGVKLVIFDYIEEPADEGDGRARWERIGNVARALKQCAQMFDISVIVFLQQNREGEEKSRVTAKAFAESDIVFQKADCGMALNRKSGQEIQKETIQAGTHRLQILKGRSHGISWSGLNLRYVGYCLRFWPAQIQFTDQNDFNEQTTAEEFNGIPQHAAFTTGSLVP